MVHSSFETWTFILYWGFCLIKSNVRVICLLQVHVSGCGHAGFSYCGPLCLTNAIKAHRLPLWSSTVLWPGLLGQHCHAFLVWSSVPKCVSLCLALCVFVSLISGNVLNYARGGGGLKGGNKRTICLFCRASASGNRWHMGTVRTAIASVSHSMTNISWEINSTAILNHIRDHCPASDWLIVKIVNQTGQSHTDSPPGCLVVLTCFPRVLLHVWPGKSNLSSANHSPPLTSAMTIQRKASSSAVDSYYDNHTNERRRLSAVGHFGSEYVNAGEN